MHFELKKNVDVTVWEPGYVASNIHYDAPPGYLTLSSKKAVSDIFSQFGTRKTHGSLLFATPWVLGFPMMCVMSFNL